MDLSSLTGMFVGVHMMLAAKTNTPELMISPEEGAEFMRAAQNVMRHYSVEATQKTLDWIALGGVAGGMYLTRGVAIAARRSQEKEERKAAGGQVLRFRNRADKNPAGLHPVPAGGQAGGEGGQDAGQAGGLVSGFMPDGIQPDHLGTAGFQPEGEHA